MAELSILAPVKISLAYSWTEAHSCLLFILEPLCRPSLTPLHPGLYAKGRAKPTLSGTHLTLSFESGMIRNRTEGERFSERRHEVEAWGPALNPMVLLRLGHPFPFPPNLSVF